LTQVMGPLDRWIPVPTTPPDPLGGESFAAHARRLAVEANEARRWVDAFDGAGRDGQPLGPFTAAFGARQTAPIDPAHLTIEAAGVRFKRDGFGPGPLVAQLMLEVEPVADEIELSWSAAAGTMDAAMLAQVAEEFETLLAGALDGDPALDALPLTSVHTRGAWMAQATTPAAPPLRRILERFLDHVANDPGAPCIVDESDRFTRQDVDLASRSVAAAIRRMGIESGARIGLALPRSGAMVAAFIGSWRAGTAYVPLDLDLPAQAIATRIEEGALAGVIVDAAAVRAHAAWLPQGVPLIPMELDLQNLPRSPDEAPLPDTSEGRALAYGLFTSGSTGRPKLVGIEHAAIASYIAAVESRLGFESGWSFATVSTFASDLGHTSIFSSLATGGVLHVVGSDQAMDPQKLAERFRASPVDVLKIVPSHLSALLSGRDPADVLSRRVLVLGGERLERGLVARIRQLAPSLRIFNHYGPTEATVGVLAHELTSVENRDETDAPPLGRPLPGCQIEVVDAAGRIVPRGVSGELWLGGPQLARGYLGRDDLTTARFVEADRQGPARRYRSGDRGWMDADGRVHFGGRIDDQLKIRGIRIEPGEIERTLIAHEQVDGAAIVAFGERLVGFVVGDAQPEALTCWLAERLPAAMVPERIVSMARLPVTANGKLDRAALVEPAAPTVDYVPPEGETERRLAAVFTEVLGVERVSVTTGFFALGGHSLLATRAVSRIREAFDVELPLNALFDEPTVRGLAPRLTISHAASLPPIAAADRGQPLPLSFAQRRMWLLDQLEPDGRAAYAIPMAARVRGDLDQVALSACVDALIARHESLRTVFKVDQSGAPTQVILSARTAVRVPIEQVDLTIVPPSEQAAAVGRALRVRAIEPFDLAHGPLLRVAVMQLTPDEHVLMVVCHHVVFDAWSRGVLMAELTALYSACVRGAPNPLPPLPIQYADYAVWQHAWLSGEHRQAELDFWKNTLAGAPALLPLPTDRPRSPQPTFRGDRVGIRVSASTTSALNALASEEGATLFIALLAAFDVLLQRLTGLDDIVVGSPIANRRRPELEHLIGFFSNTIVLRSDVSGAPTFRALLGRVRKVALDAYAHQDLPFEELVEALPVERDLSANPIFQVLFTLRNTPRDPVVLEGLRFEPLEAEAPTAKFDLTVFLEEADQGLDGCFEFATDLFDADTVQGWRDAFESLLTAAAANPDTPIDDLPLGRPLSVVPLPEAEQSDAEAS
ncbi:MAG: amino acid adenylation domain-containing protein, partial [Myxococcota bacterium]